MTNQERQTEALIRATTGQSWSNYSMIIAGFEKQGIPSSEIKCRENVFTYQAWRALGRQVRKGEHGVKICTFIRGKLKRTEIDDDGNQKPVYFSKPWRTTVFHISQTDLIAETKTA